jgi:hypothetical protein
MLVGMVELPARVGKFKAHILDIVLLAVFLKFGIGFELQGVRRGRHTGFLSCFKGFQSYTKNRW